jgi:hypothetical protein
MARPHVLLRRLTDSPRWLSALGVLAAGVIAVQSNVLVSRHFTRWDLTSQGTYTLSEPTRSLLESLSGPVEIVVLIPRSDRLIIDARHMLDAYRAISSQLKVRYVDPDAEPAEFLALQERAGIATGQTEDGRLTTDASFLVSQGDRHFFVLTEELVSVDDEGRARPRLESRLSEAIAHVVTRETEHICVTSGFGELSIDDAGPHGLSELARRLERSNFEVEPVPLDRPALDYRAFTDCSVTIVAGPERPLPEEVGKALGEHLEHGGNLLLLVPPVIDQEGRLRATGLEALTRSIGVKLDPTFVIDPDPARRLPRGVGEAFFAEPKVHPITRGLARDEERIDSRPLIVAGRALATTEDSRATVLLTSSDQSFAVGNLRPLEAAGGTLLRAPGDAAGPFPLAVAVELPAKSAPSARPGSPTPRRGARVVVVGTANLAWADSYRDANLFGARLFTENAISWLADRPALVSVPEREGFNAGLTLTEDALGDVESYVLLYMPLTAALTGVFILLRRRSTERKSREAAS